MSIKKLIAALLCSIMLTGCAGNEPQSTYDSSFWYTPSQTTTTYTEATTSQPVVTTTAQQYTLSRPKITSVSVPGLAGSTYIEFEPSKPNMNKPYSNIIYKLYAAYSIDGEKELIRDNFVGYPVQSKEDVKTYYYLIAYDTYYNVYSEYSYPYVYTWDNPMHNNPAWSDQGDTPTQANEVHRYTHTFSAPFGVTIIPLYDNANNEISKGIQPTQFEYTYTFICPRCGKRRDGWAVLARFLPYDRDGQDIWFATSCLYCDYDASGTVYSYASQIS